MHVARFAAPAQARLILDRGDDGLQRADRLFELALLVLVEPLHRLSDRPRREAGQLASEFDALNELPALLQHAHEREEGRHNLAALLEVLLDDTGIVEREMLSRQAVAGAADPTLGTPGKELQGLIIHPAEEVDVGVVPGEGMKVIDAAAGFLDRAEILALADAVQ